MRKVLIGTALVVGMLSAFIMMAAAPSQAATRTKCASVYTYTHPHSAVNDACESRGWKYEHGAYIRMSDGSTMKWVVVISPIGRVRVERTYVVCCD